MFQHSLPFCKQHQRAAGRVGAVWWVTRSQMIVFRTSEDWKYIYIYMFSFVSPVRYQATDILCNCSEGKNWLLNHKIEISIPGSAFQGTWDLFKSVSSGRRFTAGCVCLAKGSTCRPRLESCSTCSRSGLKNCGSSVLSHQKKTKKPQGSSSRLNVKSITI